MYLQGIPIPLLLFSEAQQRVQLLLHRPLIRTLFLALPLPQLRLLDEFLFLLSDGELDAFLPRPPLLLGDQADPAGDAGALQVLLDEVHAALPEFRGQGESS